MVLSAMNMNSLAVNCLIVLFTSFISTFISVRILIPFLRKHGIVGIDVHKPDRPEIPEMGGISILLGVIISLIIAILILGFNVRIIAFLVTGFLAGFIGLIDDLFVLRAKVKTLLTVLAFIPIVVFALAFPGEIVLGRPELPFIGRLRLTIVYWFLLPFAIAVPANAVNMMDTFNGVMSGCSLLASFSLFISSIILGRFDAAIMSIALFGSLLAFYWYNRYPARIFSGDVGSLFVGACIGAISVIGRLEIIGVTVLMPFIMNAFHSLRSLGGLFERREIKERPTIVRDGVLYANLNRGAPSTLANLFLRKGPASELELIHCYHLMSLVSCILGIITAYLMRVRL